MSHGLNSLKKDSANVEGDHLDALVVGAGVIGSAVAWQLAKQGMGKVMVIDPDLQGTFSSSELNAGGVRATFTIPANIEFSKLSIDFFDQHKEELGYRACGYHWLVQKTKAKEFEQRAEHCRRHGWPVEMWDVSTLRNKIAFIDKTDDLSGAFVAKRDGLINTNLLKEYFRTEAKKLGVTFVDRAWLDSSVFQHSKWNSQIRIQSMGTPGLKAALEKKGEFDGTLTPVQSRILVNCTGAWAGAVAMRMGYEVPSQAIRRQVSIFSTRGIQDTEFGMVVDPSGVYFHPEATHILAGFANHHEKTGYSFEYDGEAFFNERIWAPLFERSSHFENLKHITGWAGLYEVSPDESAIIGKVREGLFECHSFSGHGVMHSYAAGVALAELVLKEKFQTLDASVFSAMRFQKGELLQERAVI